MNNLIIAGEGVIYSAAKVGLMIFLFLYVIFASIVIKQARMMTETLEVGFESQINMIVIVHFALSVIVFLMSVIIL